jgi:hypothetical protein
MYLPLNIEEFMIRLIITASLFLSIIGCRTREQNNGLTDSSDDPPEKKTSKLFDFDYVVDNTLHQELAARSGCDSANSRVVFMQKSIPQIAQDLSAAKFPYNYIVQNMLAPQPCSSLPQKQVGSAMQDLINRLRAKNYALTVVLVGGFGSHLVERGHLYATQNEWDHKYENSGLRVKRLECMPNSYRTDDECAPYLASKVRELMASEGSTPHQYLFWGYSKGGTTVTQMLQESPDIRDNTLGVVTISSPFGGGIPNEQVYKYLSKILDKFDQLTLQERLYLTGIMMTASGTQIVAENKELIEKFKSVFGRSERLKTLAGVNSLRISIKQKFLKNVVSKWDLTRKTPHILTGKLETEIVHLAAISDITQLNITPSFKIDEAGHLSFDITKLNASEAAEFLATDSFARYPIADTCVALEHAVIPTQYKPKGLSNHLIGVLKSDHLALSLDKPTDTAAVDAIIATALAKWEGHQ